MIKFVRALVSSTHRIRDSYRRLEFRPRWVRTERQPPVPVRLGEFRFFAVISTWCEEDIIEATIQNAMAQGVERVYVMDNASPDRTTDRVTSAGGLLVDSFRTDHHDDVLKTVLKNDLVYRVSEAEGIDHIWWLWLDPDEFPRGPGATTLREYLANLDRRFRVVGATYFNHYPTSKPEYLPGFHPLDFQPMCEQFVQPPLPQCGSGHWKHPLQRFDRAGPFLAAVEGFHRARTTDGQALIEPDEGIVTHHFPFRDEHTTRDRLSNIHRGGASSRDALDLTRQSDDGRRRLRSLDAVYDRQWHDVDNLRHVRGDKGVRLRDWKEFIGPVEPVRWYRSDDIARATSAWRSTHEMQTKHGQGLCEY